MFIKSLFYNIQNYKRYFCSIIVVYPSTEKDAKMISVFDYIRLYLQTITTTFRFEDLH